MTWLTMEDVIQTGGGGESRGGGGEVEEEEEEEYTQNLCYSIKFTLRETQQQKHLSHLLQHANEYDGIET